MPRRLRQWERGRVARAFLFGGTLLVAACATTTPPGVVVIRPSPPRQPTHQLVGDVITASLGGAAVTVRWLSASQVEQYYAARPGLVFPWPQEAGKEARPTVFLLAVRNPTREEVQFDPAVVTLVTQAGRREPPIPYEELYMRLAEEGGSGPRLLSLQATLFSRFVVIPPGGQREGLLLFPALDPDAKHLLLELASFFIGGRAVPGLFEFQVLREKTE